MNEQWTDFLVLMAASLVGGAVISFYIFWRHREKAVRYAHVSRSMRWPFYAAGAIMFLTIAVMTWQAKNMPFFYLHSAAAVLQACAAVRLFIRERTQYSLRHLFIAVTIAAVLFATLRWLGMAVIIVMGVADGGFVLVLFWMEWSKSKTTEGGETSNPEQGTLP